MAKLKIRFDVMENMVAKEDGETDHSMSVALLATNEESTANAIEQVRPIFPRFPSTECEQDPSERAVWSKETMADLRCLIIFMDHFIKPVIDSLQDNLRPNVRFSELWYLFKPGQLVYVKDKDTPQKIWRVVQTSGGQRGSGSVGKSDGSEATRKQIHERGYVDFLLDCYYIDYDGTRYGKSFGHFSISRFDDVRAINTLPFYPFAVSEKEGTVDREALAKRGETFIEFSEPCHRHYSGRSQIRQPNGKYLFHTGDSESGRASRVFSENIDSEVMIDFDRALQRNPEWNPDFSNDSLYEMDARGSEEDDDDVDPFQEHVENDWRWDVRRREDFLASETQNVVSFSKGSKPRGDDLLLLPDRVFGFVLKSRRWGKPSYASNTSSFRRLAYTIFFKPP